ncbi:DUF4168 domain-containing protein [Roseovarius sp. D22-M7]|uniref:DUF4168 domain-containing protein n=1 Tax=Roseovarius sp. D22-M7 TaxID=3127116 RepID=UPI0030103D08
MLINTTLKATTTAIALALASAPMVAMTAQSAAAQSEGSYSSEELDIFTTALLEVAEVREKYTPMLQSAETEDQEASIVQEANDEIMQVIEDTDGITLDRYTEIAQAANEDQELNQRIIKRVQSMQDEM